MQLRISCSTSGSRGKKSAVLCYSQCEEVAYSCCCGSPVRSVDWERVLARKVKPPYIPAYKAPNDTSNFDKYPDSDDDSGAPLDSKDREAFKDF